LVASLRVGFVPIRVCALVLTTVEDMNYT